MLFCSRSCHHSERSFFVTVTNLATCDHKSQITERYSSFGVFYQLTPPFSSSHTFLCDMCGNGGMLGSRETRESQVYLNSVGGS
jgi:hypothetical protein